MPSSPNPGGRPVWEPLIFDYSDLISDECLEKRKAILKYRNGDVAKTTKLLELKDELNLLCRYEDWAVTGSSGVNEDAETFISFKTKDLYHGEG